MSRQSAWLHELISSWAMGVEQARFLLFLALIGTVGLLILEGRLAARSWRWLWAGLAAIAASVGAAHAWSMRWLADDAFISFRYAKNWAEGLGPVFNPGEWVEGYTNFLWMALLAAGAKLGLSIPHAAFFGNLLCLAMAIGGTASIVRRMSPYPCIPFSALALAGCSGFAEFGTSGLETMPVAAAVVLGMGASLRRRGVPLAGLAFALAVLLRPDALLLWLGFGLALVVEDLFHGEAPNAFRRLRPRRYLAYAAPLLVVYPTYFAWRWATYGTLVPHTFAVKVPGAYWEQGFFYLAHAVLTSGGWAWLPALGVALVGRPVERGETRIRSFAAIALPLFCLYLAYVGGDFMEYRFFVPLFPIAFVATEIGLRRKLRAGSGVRRWLTAAVAVAALAAVVVPIRLIGPMEFRWHLAAEHTFYRVRSLFPLEIESPFWIRGKVYGEFFRELGIAPRFATGGIGMVGYLSDLPIVDSFGLTNERIARLPVKERGRPGHERVADLDTLLEEGAVLTTDFYWPDEVITLSMGMVDDVPLLFLQYDPELLRALSRRPDSMLPDPKEDLRAVISQEHPLPVLEQVLAFYERFLRRHPDREALLDRIRARIEEARRASSSAP